MWKSCEKKFSSITSASDSMPVEAYYSFPPSRNRLKSLAISQTIPNFAAYYS